MSDDYTTPPDIPLGVGQSRRKAQPTVTDGLTTPGMGEDPQTLIDKAKADYDAQEARRRDNHTRHPISGKWTQKVPSR